MSHRPPPYGGCGWTRTRGRKHGHAWDTRDTLDEKKAKSHSIWCVWTWGRGVDRRGETVKNGHLASKAGITLRLALRLGVCDWWGMGLRQIWGKICDNGVDIFRASDNLGMRRGLGAGS